MIGEQLLKVEGITKKYSSGKVANDEISLTVRPGEVTALFGHNGAGKTTLINQIAGLVRPTEGRIDVDGIDPLKNPVAARKRMSLMPQAHAPLSNITPRQAVQAMARLREIDPKDRPQRASEVLARLEMTDWADTPGQKLSGGIRRLTAYAMAVVAPVQLFILDEPTNDVDPHRRRILWRHLRALADEGAAVLVVTHNVGEVQKSLDSAVFLDSGRVVAQGTIKELQASALGRVNLTISEAQGNSLGRISFEHYELVEKTAREQIYSIPANEAGKALSVAQMLHFQGAIEQYSITPKTFEDIYFELLGADEVVETGDGES